MSQIKWHGKAIAAAVQARTISAIDATTEEAAELAVKDRWWRARRAEQGLVSEVVTEPAHHEGGRIVGRFGSTQHRGFYGLFLELREPWLQPAADEAFPHLADRIREG